MIVRAQGVSKSFQQARRHVEVLHDVDLALEPGRLMLLMGPSGSGKTTLLSILAGLMHASSGTVELCGRDITSLSQAQLTRMRRLHVGFVFQQYNLLTALSALDNVAEPLAMRGDTISRAREKARAALERVGLGKRIEHVPADLSGGEQQRVAIARAIACEPQVIFGDEPTAALDGTTAATVVGLLREAVSASCSVLLVTHDHRLEQYADNIVELEDGRVVTVRKGAA